MLSKRNSKISSFLPIPVVLKVVTTYCKMRDYLEFRIQKGELKWANTQEILAYLEDYQLERGLCVRVFPIKFVLVMVRLIVLSRRLVRFSWNIVLEVDCFIKLKKKKVIEIDLQKSQRSLSEVLSRSSWFRYMNSANSSNGAVMTEKIYFHTFMMCDSVIVRPNTYPIIGTWNENAVLVTGGFGSP